MTVAVGCSDVDMAVIMANVIVIPERMRDDIMSHAERVAPSECVGVVAAKDIDVHTTAFGAAGALELIGLAEYNNHSPEPRTNFFVEPHAQYEVDMAFARRAWSVVGVYHSHPTTPPEPSAADLVVANGRLMLILGLAEPDGPLLRCWRVVHGLAEEVRVEVRDG